MLAFFAVLSRSGLEKRKAARFGPPDVSTPHINLPAAPEIPPFYADRVYADPGAIPFEYALGPNDSPLHRGDLEDTGDNEAAPDEMGSGPAQPTVDPTAFGGTSSISHQTSEHFDIEQEELDSDGLEVMLPSDGRLGLTNYGDKPADDWVADTGETRTPEGSEP